MQKTILIALALTSAAAPVLANSPAQREAYQAMRCDITDEQSVYWSEMSQTVTLQTRIVKNDSYSPLGFQALVLEDGTKIALGQGGKYLDDASHEDLMDCRKHLDIAKTMTLKMLTATPAQNSSGGDMLSENGYNFRTLTSLWSYSAMGQDCMDSVNITAEGPSEACIKASQFHQSYAESSADSTMSNDVFDRLTNTNAPLIKVQRSTYYSEILVYDEKAQKFYTVMTQGC